MKNTLEYGEDRLTVPRVTDPIDAPDADEMWVQSKKQAREAFSRDTEIKMTWSGKTGEAVKMTEIDGDPEKVVDVPPGLAFSMNQVKCVLMCIEHIKFVPYCLSTIDDKDKVAYGLIPQAPKKARNSKKKTDEVQVSADDACQLKIGGNNKPQRAPLAKDEEADNEQSSDSIVEDNSSGRLSKTDDKPLPDQEKKLLLLLLISPLLLIPCHLVILQQTTRLYSNYSFHH